MFNVRARHLPHFKLGKIVSNNNQIYKHKMSTKENNEVAVEKIENDKGDAKCELKGTKRAAEVSVSCIFLDLD